MSGMTYTNILNRALDLYRSERFWDAYTLVTENADRVPRNDAQFSDFRCSLACRAGKPDLAMDILRDAILNKGAWFKQQYLLEDQDMAPLRSHPDYAGLVEVCAKREAEECARAKVSLILAPSPDPSAHGRPLLVVLHGNMQNVPIAREDWASVAGSGYDMAFVRSSQMAFSDAYVWDDLERGTEDLSAAMRELSAMEGVKGRDIVLAGFSAGSRLALHAVLNDVVDVKGMVLVGPWLPEIEEWKEKLQSIKEKGVWTYILCGDRDLECLPGARTVDEVLRGAGARSDIRIVPGLDHDYPDDFGEKLHQYMADAPLAE